jgi:tRNA threonylcarbamoyladenosine biosynthesis protein TsaE
LSTLAARRSPDLVRQTHSEEETLALARTVGERLESRDWISLIGDLGSGKTVFVRGVAEALGCAESPHSPTFSIVRNYRAAGRGKLPLRHVDLYRLGPAEIPALEWEELHDEGGVTLVEWAEKARRLWPLDCLVIQIYHRGEGRREFQFFPQGARAQEITRSLRGKA